MEMKKVVISVLFVVLYLMVQVPAFGSAVPFVTQTITLNPGWNAVYLEVDPLTSDPATVFPGLPSGSSIWAWTGKNDSVQFVQDPNVPMVVPDKWLAIFNSADPTLDNFYAVTANSAYLINVADNQPRTITVTGRPTIRHKGWVPDSFNLTGFGFGSAPPTFADFFAASNSHKNQAIYRLDNTSGAWKMVADPTKETMRAGEAFWIYCQSGSDYQGPLSVDADHGDGLNFGAGVSILKLKIGNATGIDKTVSVTLLSATNPVSLSYQYLDADNSIRKSSLSAMPPIAVKAGGTALVTLVVERTGFTGDAASVVEFYDTQGNRVRVPVTATSKPVNGTGLWSGAAALGKVSAISSTTATDTPTGLNLNLILHQDQTGQVRLLKQAIIMSRIGAPGQNAVITNDKLINKFQGVTQRDGAGVGRRLSAVGFDYSPSTDASYGTDFDDSALKCTGSIATTVVCRFTLKATHPNNPFLHRFHPDHDNLADDFKTFKQEANEITRVVTLTFDTVPKENPANPPAGWGVSMLGGSYLESITGLARGAITVQGNFTISLASDVDRLNE